MAGSPLTVLLVDSDAASVDRLVPRIEELDLTCAIASSGEEALLQATDVAPGLLLIAVDLPGMDGLDTLRSLRCLEPLAEVPVLLLANTTLDEAAQAAAYELGVEDILQPEVAEQVLQVKLRHLLSRARRAREVDPHPGTQIDRYQVIRRLGRGGMGAVYLVEDESGNHCALKLFHKEDEEHEDQLDRFLREAQTLACLAHPYLVRVYGAGVVFGRGYYVMEYLDRGSLCDRLETDGRLPVAEALDITAKVAEAIHYAHSHQLLHRDLKPDNILVGPDGEPRVTDFGLVIDPTEGQRITEAGLILGTPHYMSPEQILSPENIDHRSDVFSLGMMLYEMLVGDVPFGNLGGIDAMLKIAREDITPPIYQRPEIGEAANRVVCEALVRDREVRIQTAGELGEAARAALESLRA